MFLLFYLLLFCCLLICTNQHLLNNVCNKLEAYQTIIYNPNCWYDPDVGGTPVQIAWNNGYKLEYHHVTTEDGYILTIFHIVGKSDKPVLLHHGILQDGTAFMLLKNESLAFYLTNQGYDVWLANARGTTYSSKHTKYSVYDQAFWDFSFHEIGYYDIPAIIDYIKLKIGRNRKVTIIGHSMGTSASFVYSSTRPQHAKENIKSIISMAPVAFLSNMKSSVKVLANYYELLKSVLAPLSSYGIGSNLHFLTGLSRISCSTYPGVILCAVLGEIFTGSNPIDNRPEVAPLAASLYLEGASFKTFIHYAQIILAKKRFYYYNYGELENLKRYNSTVPPEYDLGKISVPVHLYYGRNDFVADEKDVMLLYNRLQTKKTIQQVLKDGGSDYSHSNFIAAKSILKFYDMLVENL